MRTCLFGILIITRVFFVENCYATYSRDDDDQVIAADTVRVVYYLDGKRVPFSTIMEKGQKGELGDGIGIPNPKEAIRQYGEKFRYGVVFIKSKEEEDK